MKLIKDDRILEGYQWFKNGDHPLDYQNVLYSFDPEFIPHEMDIFLDPSMGMKAYGPRYRAEHNWEGDIVKYYRLYQDGDVVCDLCGEIEHNHGWIDQGEGGHKVCPGDIIISEDGNYYPVKPQAFMDAFMILEE